jgi:hypothetical protein
MVVDLTAVRTKLVAEPLTLIKLVDFIEILVFRQGSGAALPHIK